MCPTKNFQKAAVVGAGTMGCGIAQVLAMNGISTTLFDISREHLLKAEDIIAESLNKGIEKGKISHGEKRKVLDGIHYAENFDDLTNEIVIEAVTEKFEVKKEVFQRLERINSKSTILISNTSSISITKIGTCLDNPERLAGMHFFNPAYIMPLVEVISGQETNAEVIAMIKSFATSIGKVPVEAKDSPGFIVNRVARHFYTESLKVAEEQVAPPGDIDLLMESVGFKMGPFHLMDLIGLDTNLSVTTSLYNEFNQESRFRPSWLQQKKVMAGHLGQKVGKGFFTY